MQTPWQRLSRELMESLRSTTKTLQKIAAESRVDYFSVRRMKDKGFIRKTKNVVRLCKYLGINANGDPAKPGDINSIVRELRAAWDGSEPHAQLLVELIRSTRKFKVSRTRSDTIGRVPHKSGSRARK